MKSLDIEKLSLEEARNAVVAAETPEAQKKAWEGFTNALEASIIAKAKLEAESVSDQSNDNAILTSRGTTKVFTKEEMKFFNAVVERKGFEGVEEFFPVTIVEDIIGKIKTEHPLLSLIDVKSTSALVRWVFPKPNATQAYWGPLCEDIRQMFLGGFQSVEIMASRLSGLTAICKAMLELGPRWLGQYIYESIYEIMNTELEKAVVNGTGANQPIGMMRSTINGTVADGVTTYAEKAPFAVDAMTPVALAGVRGTLAQAKMGGPGVVYIMSEKTYYNKVYNSLAYQDVTGSWHYPIENRLITGERVIFSEVVPDDRVIVGDPKKYFLGVAGRMRIEEYEQTLAIEDMQLYIAKMYAMGMAKDPNAFIVLDLSAIPDAAAPALEVAADPVVTP